MGSAGATAAGSRTTAVVHPPSSAAAHPKITFLITLRRFEIVIV
jgi:hypothetical protein